MTLYDVTVTDGSRVERRRGIPVEERDRIRAFAERHGLRFHDRPADPRPERRSYR